jgi:iron(III) transport system substrate-binding protein
MQSRSGRCMLLALLPIALACPLGYGAKAADAPEVNVYSYRQPYLIDPLLKKFTEETGIKVHVIFAEKGLIERIATGGRNTPADLLLTVDVGNLMQAPDTISLNEIAALRKKASELIDKVGFDDGPSS